MKILQNEAVNAARIGQVQGTSPVSSKTAVPGQGTNSAAAAESPAATVSFSSAAQQIASVTAAVNAQPDTRDELVQSLKAKIANGQYNVSSSDIADMMLRRHAADQVK